MSDHVSCPSIVSVPPPAPPRPRPPTPTHTYTHTHSSHTPLHSLHTPDVSSRQLGARQLPLLTASLQCWHKPCGPLQSCRSLTEPSFITCWRGCAQGMALRCLSPNPHARPAMDEIEGQLGGMVAALAAGTLPKPLPFPAYGPP